MCLSLDYWLAVRICLDHATLSKHFNKWRSFLSPLVGLSSSLPLSHFGPGGNENRFSLIFLFPGSLIWLLEQDSKLPSSAFTRVNRRWCSGPVKILKTQTALVLWPTEADVNIKGRNCFFLLGKVMEAKEPESGLSSGLAGTAGQLSVSVHSAVPSYLCLQIRDLASRPAGLDCVLRSPGKLISAQWFV